MFFLKTFFACFFWFFLVRSTTAEEIFLLCDGQYTSISGGSLAASTKKSYVIKLDFDGGPANSYFIVEKQFFKNYDANGRTQRVSKTDLAYSGYDDIDNGKIGRTRLEFNLNRISGVLTYSIKNFDTRNEPSIRVLSEINFTGNCHKSERKF